MSICSNIKGLEARHDSDTIILPIPVEEVVLDTSPENETASAATQVKIPDMDKSLILEVIVDDDVDDSQENKSDKWNPKALKTRVSNVLKSDTATKASVTSKLDKLSAARLELVLLQIETARKEQQFKEEEHRLKMVHLANDERRKEEIHALLKQKMSRGPVSNDMI